VYVVAPDAVKVTGLPEHTVGADGVIVIIGPGGAVIVKTSEATQSDASVVSTKYVPATSPEIV
jgi:hypothetical protein